MRRAAALATEASGGGLEARGGRPIEGSAGPGARATDPDIDNWAERIVASLAHDGRYEYCAVLVPEPGGAGLRVAAERAAADGSRRRTAVDTLVPVDASVCGTVLLTAAPVLLADVRDIEHYYRIPGSEMRSELAVPVLAAGRALAVINVESRRVAGFDIGDLQRLERRAAEAASVAPDALRGAR